MMDNGDSGRWGGEDDLAMNDNWVGINMAVEELRGDKDSRGCIPC